MDRKEEKRKEKKKKYLENNKKEEKGGGGGSRLLSLYSTLFLSALLHALKTARICLHTTVVAPPERCPFFILLLFLSFSLLIGAEKKGCSSTPYLVCIRYGRTACIGALYPMITKRSASALFASRALSSMFT